MIFKGIQNNFIIVIELLKDWIYKKEILLKLFELVLLFARIVVQISFKIINLVINLKQVLSNRI